MNGDRQRTEFNSGKTSLNTEIANMLAWGGIQMADRKDNSSEDRKIPDRQPERLPGHSKPTSPLCPFVV